MSLKKQERGKKEISELCKVCFTQDPYKARKKTNGQLLKRSLY